MSKQGLGTLANLAKILEEASNPESQVREDRREVKPKALQKNSSSASHQKKVYDPKRKAWYEKRLKEQSDDQHTCAPAATPDSTIPTQAVTRASAANASSGLLDALAAAREVKSKDGSKRPEAWKRKPGDPIF